MPWPEPVERVAAYLRASGAEARLEEFNSGTELEIGGGGSGANVQQLVLPSQPSQLDPRGYPGWVPRRQLTARPPVSSGCQRRR